MLHRSVRVVSLNVLLVFTACGQMAKEETESDASIDTAFDADSTNPEETNAETVDTVGDSADGSSSEDYVYQPPNESICDNVLHVDSGFLCAIRPSKLDAQARDIFSSGSIGDKNLGFGYHVVAFPKPETVVRGVYVHFTGSMGRPYHPVSQNFPSRVLLEEAMTSGFVVLQPAYHNRYSVNSENECVGSNNVDNCAGLVRLEKILGEDKTSVVDVPLADGITERIRKLNDYFNEEGIELPVSILIEDEVNWSQLRIGGHSQGSGHALYIGKYWGSEHLCLFGGPYDIPDTVPSVPTEMIADWYLDASSSVNTTKIRALLSTDDEHYSNFLIAYDVLGLEEGIHWESFSADSYSDFIGAETTGHGAVVHDPAFAAERYAACFDSF